MSLSSIFDLMSGAKDNISLVGLILIILASCVQVSKIPINPWDWFFNLIGKKLNQGISGEVEEIKKNLNKHIEDNKKERLESNRRDILDFCNACMNGRRHTQEQFLFVLKTCDLYETYIEENHLKNGEISSAIAEIRRLYSLHLQKNDFLKPGEEFKKD